MNASTYFNKTKRNDMNIFSQGRREHNFIS